MPDNSHVPIQFLDDFELNEQGLYVATRKFLLKRKYCCGNGCQNCPYPPTPYPNGNHKPKCRKDPIQK